MDVIELTSELVRYDSTCFLPNAAVVDFLDHQLRESGFCTERIEYIDRRGVLKSGVIGKAGSGDGGLAWFGHTDVVVSDGWAVSGYGPFEPHIKDDRLYGRGTTDMKGPIACMLTAVRNIADRDVKCPIYVSCSADEEIDHRGVIEISQQSHIFQQLVAGGAVAVVGEPTSLDVVYAHKGGIQIRVTSLGRAAHSSTADGINANLAMIPFLQIVRQLYEESLVRRDWMDEEFDPPVLCMNPGINDGTRAVNITAPQSVCTISIRPMPNTATNEILSRLRAAADASGLQFEIVSNNPPFRRDPESVFARRCRSITGGRIRTVAYGSEAGNLTAVKDVVVLGPGSIEQAHRNDEWISLEQLHRGVAVYEHLIREYCL